MSVTNPKDVTAGVTSLVLHPRDDTQLSHQSGQQHSNILHRCLATNLEDLYAAKNNSLDVFERKDVQLPQNMVMNSQAIIVFHIEMSIVYLGYHPFFGRPFVLLSSQGSQNRVQQSTIPYGCSIFISHLWTNS